MKRKIKISLGQLKSLLSYTQTRPKQSITIIMKGIDRNELSAVMEILRTAKKS